MLGTCINETVAGKQISFNPISAVVFSRPSNLQSSCPTLYRLCVSRSEEGSSGKFLYCPNSSLKASMCFSADKHNFTAAEKTIPKRGPSIFLVMAIIEGRKGNCGKSLRSGLWQVNGKKIVKLLPSTSSAVS